MCNVVKLETDPEGAVGSQPAAPRDHLQISASASVKDTDWRVNLINCTATVMCNCVNVRRVFSWDAQTKQWRLQDDTPFGWSQRNSSSLYLPVKIHLVVFAFLFVYLSNTQDIVHCNLLDFFFSFGENQASCFPSALRLHAKLS